MADGALGAKENLVCSKPTSSTVASSSSLACVNASQLTAPTRTHSSTSRGASTPTASTVTDNGLRITSSDTRLYGPRSVIEVSDWSLILADCGEFRLCVISRDRHSIKTIAIDGEDRSIIVERTRAT